MCLRHSAAQNTLVVAAGTDIILKRDVFADPDNGNIVLSHRHEILCIDTSPDCQLGLTSCVDGTLTAWDLTAAGGKKIMEGAIAGPEDEGRDPLDTSSCCLYRKTHGLGGLGKRIAIWDLVNRTRLRKGERVTLLSSPIIKLIKSFVLALSKCNADRPWWALCCV